MKKNREQFASKIGFITAAAGSAIGLANIWRFPFITAQYGGGAFICVYLLFLLLIGFPVLIAEISAGKRGRTSPSGTFLILSKGKRSWQWLGKITILTGFLISSFYSVVAGWIIGYLVQAIQGKVVAMNSIEQASNHYLQLLSSPSFNVFYHFVFMFLSYLVLTKGVRKGIEWVSKFLVPLLFGLLLLLIVKGISHLNSPAELSFLIKPEFSKITTTAILIALGQAFFTLSLGQGTMITYGSYLPKKQGIIEGCLWIVVFDTLAALLSAFAIFSIAGITNALQFSGPGLIFSVLPVAFHHLSGGYFFSILFFLLVVIAALTSQISAMEPLIAYLRDEKKWPRELAVLFTAVGAFILGIPSALSFSYLKGFVDFYGLVSFVSLNVLVPLGGLFAALLVGWKWGAKKALHEIELSLHHPPVERKLFGIYFTLTWKIIAPALILVILLDSLWLAS